MLGMKKGIGTMYKVDSNGNVIDCDAWSNIFQGPCWNPFASTVLPTTSMGEPLGASSSNSDVLVPTTDYASGAAVCSSSLISGMCDTTLYLIGGGLVLGLLLLRR